MNLPAILNTPFMQVALPIIVTFAIATWYQSTRIDDVNRRIDDLRSGMNRQFVEVNKRLDRIETLLQSHEQRITRVEERASPIRQ